MLTHPFRRAVAPLAVALLALVPALPATAQLFETRAEHAILVDYESGTVLFQKEADTPMAPASMAKLMTMAVVFNAIRAGQLKLDDEFVVGENAWRRGGANSGGSTMFAKLGSSVAVADLMRGVIVQSGNDACITIAEGMSGTEEAFARRMNAEAAKIGLTSSTFRNATGLPDPEQRVTARDLMTLASYIIREFPEFYPIYGLPEFTWNGITQKNRNPLLAMNIGADGMKTGFIEESGYGMVGSAVRDGRRLIVVINGTKSEKERAEEARKLLEWGFRAFRKVPLFGPDEIIAEADVFGGAAATVGLRSGGPVEVLLPDASDQVKASVVYSGPVPAPVTAGQAIGVLAISIDGTIVMRAPLIAAADVPVGSLPQRAQDALFSLLFGWL